MSDGFLIGLGILGIIVAPVAAGYAIYLYCQQVTNAKKRVKEELAKPELTLKELAEYQKWVFRRVADPSFLGDRSIEGLLELKNPADEKKIVYAHVSKEIQSNCVAFHVWWTVFDVVAIDQSIKHTARKKREAEELEETAKIEYQETLERIRRGETSVESSSSPSSGQKGSTSL
ncbi:MAG: hypothetical protein AAB389_02650 [Patescibacteria group bacterium]